jgi:hypothetical protein
MIETIEKCFMVKSLRTLKYCAGGDFYPEMSLMSESLSI